MLQVDSPSLFTSLSPDEVELELFDRDPTLFGKSNRGAAGEVSLLSMLFGETSISFPG